MKKRIKILIFTLIIGSTIIWKSFSTEAFPYDWDRTNNPNVDFASGLKINIKDDSNWLKRLLNLFMPSTTPEDTIYWSVDSPSFLFYLKTVINLLLSFVSLIALIFLIFAFYMIFFKKDDAGINTAKQMIKWITIALVVIWLSRIVVSFLFRFENKNTEDLWYHNNTEIITSLT